MACFRCVVIILLCCGLFPLCCANLLCCGLFPLCCANLLCCGLFPLCCANFLCCGWFTLCCANFVVLWLVYIELRLVSVVLQLIYTVLCLFIFMHLADAFPKRLTVHLGYTFFCQ